jgi:hypothetical protein
MTFNTIAAGFQHVEQNYRLVIETNLLSCSHCGDAPKLEKKRADQSAILTVTESTEDFLPFKELHKQKSSQ